mgnify:FL=1
MNKPRAGITREGRNAPLVRIKRIEQDFPLDDFSNCDWAKAESIRVTTNWDASSAGIGREFCARLLYSGTGIYALFDASQTEELVITDNPITCEKSIGLWERDVFEIFLAPERSAPEKYFEFEVSPLAEWLDLALEIRSGERISNWNYHSGMKTASRIERSRVLAAVFIPFAAFPVVPKSGDIWRGNVFRCIGREPGRGYLAWQPTLTPEPSFHVPERFGYLEFE